MSLDNSVAIIHYNKKDGMDILLFDSEASKEISTLDGVKSIYGTALDKRIDTYIKAANEENYVETKGLYDFLEKVKDEDDVTLVKKLYIEEFMEFINWLMVSKTKCNIYVETNRRDDE